MHFQIQNGFVGPNMLDIGVKKGILYRIANSVGGYRLPKGVTFEAASLALGMNAKALTKARKQRLAAKSSQPAIR